MRGRATRTAFALTTAGLLALAIAGCSQQEQQKSDYKIVEQVQVDANGTEVPTAAMAPAADPAGNGQATCQGVAIAMAGALTGPDAQLGINIKNGAQLAIDKHNAANPNCQVALKPFDTEGDPQKATGVAQQIINDPQVIGLIGPAFSGETESTGQIFATNGLVAATASATRTSLSKAGWPTFIRGLGNDDVQGKSVANDLQNPRPRPKVGVIDDSTAYGSGLAQSVSGALAEVGDPACKKSVKKGDKDFGALVTEIKNANPGAIYFAGYYAEAAPLVQQLRDGGVTATFVSGDGTKDPEFVKQAGQSSKDALLSCPCGPSPAGFADEYSKKFNQPPSTYSNEGYDLATIMLKGIDAGATTRLALLDFVRGYSGDGVARRYQWTPEGELLSTNIWIYKVVE